MPGFENFVASRFSEEGEEELRRLARHLRTAIQQHVRMAKSSLGTKKSAIVDRDSDRDRGGPRHSRSSRERDRDNELLEMARPRFQFLVGPALRGAVPAMFLQFCEQALVERAGVAGGDVLADVLGLSHAGDLRADRGMRQDEAQCHLRQ